MTAPQEPEPTPVPECATCGDTGEVAGYYCQDDGIGPCPDCTPEPASDRFFNYGVTL